MRWTICARREQLAGSENSVIVFSVLSKEKQNTAERHLGWSKRSLGKARPGSLVNRVPEHGLVPQAGTVTVYGAESFPKQGPE